MYLVWVLVCSYKSKNKCCYFQNVETQPSLFEEDSSSDDNEKEDQDRFRLRLEFEGKKGQKVSPLFCKEFRGKK